MTIGYWRQEASAGLRAAAQAMTGQRAADPADVYALIDARNAAYTYLGRMVTLLVGGRPVAEVPGRETASLILEREGQSLTRLYVGVQAAVVDGAYPVAAAPPGPAAAAVRRAADAVGVMGDILASHLRLDERMLPTPEGLAIRGGGGVQAGIGDVAQLTLEMLAVDARLPGWLDDASPVTAQAYRPVVEAARWAGRGRLADAADDLVQAAVGQPGMLAELDVTRLPQEPVRAVDTGAEALAAVGAAEGWLLQRRDGCMVDHLKVGTALGLAVHRAMDVAGVAPDGAGARWRAAAEAARELRGTPAVGEGRLAGLELAEAMRWARRETAAIETARTVPDTVLLGDLGRLADRLPGLAATLYSGLQDGVRRHDVWLSDRQMVRPHGSLTWRAVERWRPAHLTEDRIRDLSRILMRLSGTRTPGQTARQAAVLRRAAERRSRRIPSQGAAARQHHDQPVQRPEGPTLR